MYITLLEYWSNLIKVEEDNHRFNSILTYNKKQLSVNLKEKLKFIYTILVFKTDSFQFLLVELYDHLFLLQTVDIR